MNKISILLPTRGRRDVMLDSVKGLLSKAADPQRLELLLGIDNDDDGKVDNNGEIWSTSNSGTMVSLNYRF